MKVQTSILLFLLLLTNNVLATHNRAGEITYKQTSLLTYEVTIVTYTKDSAPADRCELEILWGDGTVDTLTRTNGPALNGCPHSGELVGNDIKKNIYIGNHTYPAIGTYIISMFDPNRNSDIANIPNSVNTPFYIESIININPDLGYNNSPTLLNPPIDNGCVGHIFIHNPSAFDIDGDSLSYSLVHCSGINGNPIPGYIYPETANSVDIDPITGDFSWNYPTQQQQVNIAILITEHRKNSSGTWVIIGEMVRDMQIDIADCLNDPPIITTIDKICVEAGQIINFDVSATDINFDQISISATGGPFEISDSASFVIPFPAPGSISSTFEWITHCHHVRNQPYFIVFKAEDNGNPNLVDIKTVQVTVISPSPKNPFALANGTGINLSWDASICQEVIEYDIYRNNSFFGFIPDSCETGVPPYTGYNYIESTFGLNNTSFFDSNNGNGLIPGLNYCYMIVAKHPDGAESYASLEFCAELIRDVPIITNVNVLSTDSINGEIEIVWSKPTEFDSILAPGPYIYDIYLSNDAIGNNLIYLQTQNGGINDTIFLNQNINTSFNPYSYIIDFINNTPQNTFTIGSSILASSIFIDVSGGDNIVTLSWAENTPWINNSYIIYKLNNTTSIYDSIGVSSEQSYIDYGLENNTEYCYKIKSIGAYSGTGLINPIINFSQIQCVIPQDTFPPCSPILNVTDNCEIMTNTLDWNLPNDSCGNDIEYYDIYYANSLTSDYNFINSSIEYSYTHDLSLSSSIAGLYYVIAVDSMGNKSEPSNIVQADNCPEFQLPNVFTPNGDSWGENPTGNNLYTPVKNAYIEKVETKIYNRWGNLVYTSNDPQINWNGKHFRSQKNCSEGVYFVSCKIYEIHLNGIFVKEVKTFVHLFR